MFIDDLGKPLELSQRVSITGLEEIHNYGLPEITLTKHTKTKMDSKLTYSTYVNSYLELERFKVGFMVSFIVVKIELFEVRDKKKLDDIDSTNILIKYIKGTYLLYT